MGVAALRHAFIRPLQANADRRISEEEWIDIQWRDQLGVDAGVIVACDLGITAGQGLVAGICSSWSLERAEMSVEAHQVEVEVRVRSPTGGQRPPNTG